MVDSKEARYRTKCKDLRRRIRQIEQQNDALSLRLSRTRRGVLRMRLERALLYEKLHDRTPRRIGRAEADGTPSPPDSPKLGELPPPPEPSELLKNSVLAQSAAASMAAAANNGAKKTIRDPFAPKRPTNPFLHFCESERERVRSEVPGTGEPGELTKALGAAWQQLDDEGRKPYVEMYEQDKTRYEQEKEDYIANGGDQSVVD